MTHLVVAALALAATACRDRSDPKKDAPPPSQAAAAARAEAPAKAPPNWAGAMKHEVRFDPAGHAVVVTLDIAPGFHAYAEGETVGRPLALAFTPDSELVLDGAVRYPAGTARDLPIGRSVIVEGRAEITAKVKAAGGDEAGKKAKGNLQYQICTEDSCDRPKVLSWEVSAPPKS